MIKGLVVNKKESWQDFFLSRMIKGLVVHLNNSDLKLILSNNFK